MGTAGIDASILLFIQENLRCGALDLVMKCITYLGEFGALWILLGLALMISKKTRHGGLGELVCLAAEYLLNDQVLKRLIDRARPYEIVPGLTRIIEAQSSASFPSGHAASSFAAATALTLAFGKKGAWAYIPAVLIAFSRVYVGVHYPSDILAGAAVGVIASLIVWWIYERVTGRGSPERGAGSRQAD